MQLSIRVLARSISKARNVPIEQAQRIAEAAVRRLRDRKPDDAPAVTDALVAATAAQLSIPNDVARARLEKVIGEPVKVSLRDLARQLASQRGIPLEQAQRIADRLGR